MFNLTWLLSIHLDWKVSNDLCPASAAVATLSPPRYVLNYISMYSRILLKLCIKSLSNQLKPNVYFTTPHCLDSFQHKRKQSTALFPTKIKACAMDQSVLFSIEVLLTHSCINKMAACTIPVAVHLQQHWVNSFTKSI